MITKNDTGKDVLNKKNITICILATAIVLILVVLLGQCNKDTEGDVQNTEQYVITETETPTVDASYYDLKKDEIPALNELICTYFAAMESCDLAQYTNIVTGDDMTQDKLEKKGEFIESYQNISCYTKPGVTADTYIAYVYYEVKFRNIDTLAPALSQLFVCTNEDGTMYINAGALDPELSGYISVMSSAEDVLELNVSTEKKLVQAIESDEKLLLLIQKLREGAEYVEETEDEPEIDSDSGEMTFEECNEKVLTTAAVKVRSTPDAEGTANVIGRLDSGETIKRTGYNDKWSRIEYQGKVAYVASDYLILK